MLWSCSDRVVHVLEATLDPSSLLLSTVGSEIIEAFVHVVQLMLESFSLTGGHHLVHLSVQGPTKDTSVWAVAWLAGGEFCCSLDQ